MTASAMTERTVTFAKPANASKTLAKIVHVDWGREWPLIQRVEDGQHVLHHSFRVRPFTDIDDALGALRGAAIGGEIMLRAWAKAWQGRRAIYDDAEKGPAGLEVRPCWHGSCDWDGLKTRPKLRNGESADPLLHPEAWLEEIRLALPPEWRDKSMILQVSASAGLKGPRFRTHHILDKPRFGKDLKTWLRPAIERKLLDPATLVECQPIYLAVNLVGGHDPCPERFTLVRGEGGDVCTTDGLDRALEHQRKLAEQEQERRDKLADAMKARRQNTEDSDARAFAATVAKAERAITSAHFRHPEYLKQMARVRAITEKHGGDWPAAAQRLQDAYRATLSADEAKRREKSSVTSIKSWMEARP